MKDIPVYRFPAEHARENGELELYRASNKASAACKEAIEKAISEHYCDKLIPGAIQTPQFCIRTDVKLRHMIIIAIQLFKCRTLADIKLCQVVSVAIQNFKCRTSAHIKLCQQMIQ